MDNLNKEQRSFCMSKIRSKHTKPELVVRKILSGLNLNYRLYSIKLPGKPDIIILKSKAIIFVNGCFWHQHKNCKKQVMPKTNQNYWNKKLGMNTKKQKNDIIKLKKLGWKVCIIWECETKNRGKLLKKLFKFL